MITLDISTTQTGIALYHNNTIYLSYFTSKAKTAQQRIYDQGELYVLLLNYLLKHNIKTQIYHEFLTFNPIRRFGIVALSGCVGVFVNHTYSILKQWTETIHPSEWKKNIGLKGNAKKDVIKAKFIEMTGIDKIEQDSIDAFFMLICVGKPESYQIKVLDKIITPKDVDSLFIFSQ